MSEENAKSKRDSQNEIKQEVPSLGRGCLLALLYAVKSKVFWAIGFVFALLLAKGLEPHVNVIMHYDIPMQTKVAQVQLIWPDALDDGRVPLMFMLFFGRDADPTPTPDAIAAPAAVDAPKPTQAPPSSQTPAPTVSPAPLTDTPLPPSVTPLPTKTPLPPSPSPLPSKTPQATPIPPSPMPSKTPPPTTTPLPPTSAPSPGDGSCDNAPPPQLEPGHQALQLGADALRLRDEPGRSGNIVARVYRMQRLTVLEGPVCSSRLYFYRVETDDGARGWIAEAESAWNRREAWLARAMDDGKCWLDPRFVVSQRTKHDYSRSISVRQAPDRNAPETGRAISSDLEVKVLAGPVCADGFVWYKMQNESRGVLGWAQQGSGDQYFFAEPLPPTLAPTATATPLPPTLAPTATATPIPPTLAPTATDTPIPPTLAPTATATPIPPTSAPSTGDGSCDNTPPPQLEPGHQALQLGADALRLRDEPGRSGNIVARVYRMQRLTVLEGPVCSSRLYFYRVETDDGARGWIAEAESAWNRREAWLARAMDDGKCWLDPRFVVSQRTKHDYSRSISVRQAPDRNAPETGRAISSGLEVKVLAGPVCADGFVWYKMQNESRGVLGWAQQGLGDQYFFAEPHGFDR